MTFAMKLTDGSNTLFDLTDGTNCLVDGDRAGWIPGTAMRGEEWVSDTISLVLLGGIATVQSNARTIRRVIERGAEYEGSQHQRGAPVYIEVQISDADGWWRAAIRDGDLTEISLDRVLFSGVLPCYLTLERAYGLEKTTEVQVPLSNENGSNNTSGLTVFSCNDQSGSAPNKRTNVVKIAAANVAGDLPARCRLEVVNTYNNAISLAHLYVGHNVYSDPAAFNPILEGEAASGAGGSNVAESTCSGGSYRQFTLSSDGDTDMFTWALSSAFVAQTKGLFRILARFHALSNTDVWFRPVLYYNNVVPLWYGTPVRPSSSYAMIVRDLGEMRLPPWIPGVGSPSALSLRLTGKRAAGVSATVRLDYLLLLPLDGYRYYELVGEVPYLSAVIDDQINEKAYTQDGSAANRQGNVVAWGDGFRLLPGYDQALHFQAHSNYANIAEITRTMSVKLYYRPRIAAI
jgi:hypothetical protein